MCQVICLICINSRINYHPLVIKPIGGDAYEVFTIYLICRIILCPRGNFMLSLIMSPWALWTREKYPLRLYFAMRPKLYSKNVEAMFLWGWSYVPVGLKLCSCGIEAMFLWDWSYVLVGLKLCSQCCNAIEKDCSLRREWLEPTQRTFVRQAAKTDVENRNGYVLPSWQNKDWVIAIYSFF